MFTGLTLANVLGVPLGTALGQEAGWRSTFWAVTVIGVIALIGLIRFLPAKRDEENSTCAPNWPPSKAPASGCR
jgi:DHA1 family inner membrane transport protein